MIRTLFERVSIVGTLLSFAVMIAVVLLQVISRYFLPFSVHWTEEAARFAFLYTIAFASGLAVRDKAYVNVDLVPILLRGRARVVLELLIDVVTLVFLAVLFQHSLRLVQLGGRQTSAALRVPMSRIFAVTSLIPASMAFFTVADIVRIIRTHEVQNVGSERLAGETVVHEGEEAHGAEGNPQ